MARKTIADIISDQRKVIPPVVKADLTGKTVVVVGANVGLGFEASKHFATMNPERLILACRDQGKGDAAITSKIYPFPSFFTDNVSRVGTGNRLQESRIVDH
jgi:retinol dehydrogenase 12